VDGDDNFEPVIDETSAVAKVSEGLLLVGHGSRSPRSALEMRKLAALVADGLAGVDVQVGFLEMTEPPAGVVIDSMVARGAGRITVLPLVLLGAGHAKNDVPAVVLEARRRHPGAEILFASPLGVVKAAVEILGEAVAASLGEAASGSSDADTALLVVSRGTSDPDANGDSYKAGRLIAEWSGNRRFGVGFSGVTSPTIVEAAQTLATLGHRRIAVSWWYLCYGLLIERGRAQLRSWADGAGVELVDCGYLGPDVRLVEPIVERFHESKGGTPRVNCDACSYRSPWPGLAERVGQPVGVGHSHLAEEHRRHHHHDGGAEAHDHAGIEHEGYGDGGLDGTGHGRLQGATVSLGGP